jgi:hypothetical protein
MSNVLNVIVLTFIGFIAGFVLSLILSADKKRLVEAENNRVLQEAERLKWKMEHEYVLKKDVSKLLMQSGFTVENILPQALERAHNGVMPLELLFFLPLVNNALVNAHNGNLRSNQGKDLETFFAAFPYVEAAPYLLQALNSAISIPTDTILAKQSLDKKQETRSYQSGDYEYGGSFGEEEGYYETVDTIQIETFELSCDSYYPVIEGAKKSLTKIAESAASHREEILEAITKADSRPKDVFKKTEVAESIIDTETNLVITRHESSVR